MKALNNEGLAYFFGKLKTKFVSAEPGKRLITEAEAAKLASVPAKAKALVEQVGTFANAGSGWNSFTYPFPFSDDVRLFLTPGNVEIMNQTRSGFLYCVYKPDGTMDSNTLSYLNWQATVMSEDQLCANIARAAAFAKPLDYLTLPALFSKANAAKIIASEPARNLMLDSARATAAYLCTVVSLSPSDYPEMTSLCEDSAAISLVANNQVAMETLAASNVAMTAVAASNVAMTAVINSTVALPMVVNSNVAMTAVAASNVAMTAVINSTVALPMVVNSNVAMTAVINSTVALRLIALSNTAKNAVIRENARLQSYRLQIYTTVKNSPAQFKLISSLQSIDIVTQANRVASNYIVFATVGQYADNYPGSATMYHGHNGSTIITRDVDCNTNNLYVGLGGATFTEYNDGRVYFILYEAIV